MTALSHDLSTAVNGPARSSNVRKVELEPMKDDRRWAPGVGLALSLAISFIIYALIFGIPAAVLMAVK